MGVWSLGLRSLGFTWVLGLGASWLLGGLLGFRVWGSGSRVWGLRIGGFSVFRALLGDSGFGSWGSEFPRAFPPFWGV